MATLFQGGPSRVQIGDLALTAASWSVETQSDPVSDEQAKKDAESFADFRDCEATCSGEWDAIPPRFDMAQFLAVARKALVRYKPDRLSKRRPVWQRLKRLIRQAEWTKTARRLSPLADEIMGCLRTLQQV